MFYCSMQSSPDHQRPARDCFLVLVAFINFFAPSLLASDQYLIQYWAENQPTAIDPMPGTTPDSVATITLDAAPLVLMNKTILNLPAENYLLDREGLYRVLRSGDSGVVRQIILYRGDVWRLVSHLDRLYVYGTRHAGESQSQLTWRSQHGEAVSLQCGHVSQFIQSHLAEAKIPSRLVSCVAKADWNNFDDGHALLEINDPGTGKWVLFDATLGARYCDDVHFLTLQELTEIYRAGRRPKRIDFINANSKVDPLFDYDAFYATFQTDRQRSDAAAVGFRSMLDNNVEQIHRWYARVMQIPLIDRYFVVTNDQEEALMRSLDCWKTFHRLSRNEFWTRFYAPIAVSARESGTRGTD
jgi:hypothetical protein